MGRLLSGDRGRASKIPPPTHSSVQCATFKRKKRKITFFFVKGVCCVQSSSSSVFLFSPLFLYYPCVRKQDESVIQWMEHKLFVFSHLEREGNGRGRVTRSENFLFPVRK